MPGRFLLGAAAVVLGASAPVLFEPVESTRDLWIAIGVLIVAVQTSEDLTCIAAGILVADGFISFWWATFGCFMGLMLGDCGLYLLGFVFGRTALEWRWLRKKVPERAVTRWRRGYENRGFRIVFISRFLPGARVPMYFAAGMLGFSFWKFTAYLALAAWLWTPLLVGVAALAGAPFLDWFETNRVWAILGLIGTVMFLWFILHQGIPLFTWSGRRRALGFWRRKLRWEFWPRLVFYPPVAVYVLWLMWKHRSATLFTAVNPGMPGGGGFLMETKSEIFEGLGDLPEIPKWRRIPGGELHDRMEGLEAYLEEHGIQFPVILKPDFGLRGRDVVKIQSLEEAREYFAHMSSAAVAQEYEGGIEYGVFYVRMPDEEKGRIFSIAEKKKIGVTGSGNHSLESLILADDRAVCMAPYFMRKHEESLDLVLEEGEFFQLTEVGSHCRGALFLNAADCNTPELAAAIDRISANYEGFYFGRYDIKVPSRDDFKAGKNLRILELNGVTGEAAHIYHPGTPLMAGYRALFEQWRIAFEIAEKNVAAGAKPLTLRQVNALWKEYRAA